MTFPSNKPAIFLLCDRPATDLEGEICASVPLFKDDYTEEFFGNLYFCTTNIRRCYKRSLSGGKLNEQVAEVTSIV